MAQYIDKDALVAEIEKRLEKVGHYNPAAYMEHRYLLSFLDTLEVKEVDLDGECRKYLTEHFNVYEDGILQSKRSNLPLDAYDVIKIAKHFFELGLNAQCKISYVPNIDDSLEELGVDPTSKNAKIFKESYYMALEKLKAQKGE